MTPREFAERIITGEFRFPFTAAPLIPRKDDPGPGFLLEQKTKVLDRDGKVVAEFDNLSSAISFIEATAAILRVVRDARARAN